MKFVAYLLNRVMFSEMAKEAKTVRHNNVIICLVCRIPDLLFLFKNCFVLIPGV
jgi:hypothetical protein